MLRLKPGDLALIVLATCAITLSGFSWYIGRELNKVKDILSDELEYQTAERKKLQEEIKQLGKPARDLLHTKKPKRGSV